MVKPRKIKTNFIHTNKVLKQNGIIYDNLTLL